VADPRIRIPLTPHPATTHTPMPSLPPETHPSWAGLINGSIRHEFGYAAAGMLIFNLNLQWKRDPSRLPQLIGQVRSFFQKYQTLLGQDVVKLFT
jgi:hypothetical protein